MAFPRACLALWSLCALALAQQPVAPSNSSSFQSAADKNQTAVLVAAAYGGSVELLPLTSGAFDALPNGPRSTAALGGYLVEVNSNNSQSVTADSFAFTQCDEDAWPGYVSLSDVVNNLVQTNVSAIVFYSLTAPVCNLTTTLPMSYDRVYSTTNTDNATAVMQRLSAMFGSKGAAAMLFSQDSYNRALQQSENGGGLSASSPSTAVAMIILYSITGVITALFLIIIVTGAVRAHRHPERYGPRNVLGRTRQSRAKGIARAMLDTIPIVKFGQDQTAKPTDVELAEAQTGQEGSHEPAANESKETHAETTKVNASLTGDASDQRETVEPSSAEQGSSSHEAAADTSAEHLGCSICTEDFEQGQDLRVLPCDHKFHPACVDPWLLDVSGTCPLCRVDLRPAESRRSTDEDANAESGEMPPPLDPNGWTSSRRRTLLRALIDRRTLNDASREERIETLRRIQQQQRQSNRNTETAGEATAEQQENQTRWNRVRRSLHLRAQPRS